jgi:hypothetical protein
MKKVKHILAQNAKTIHAYKQNVLVFFVEMYACKHIGHVVFSTYLLKHHFFPEKYAYKHIYAYLPTPGSDSSILVQQSC